LLKIEYDTVIDLQNSKRTSIYNLFFRLFSKSLICSSRPFGHLRYKIPVQGKESVRIGLSNQLKLLNIITSEKINYEWLKVDMKDEITQPNILIIPGISKGNEHKQWQPERFADIAKYCELKKFTIYIVGTKLDLFSAEAILSKCKNAINKIDFSPPEVIYSIALKSSLIISNDTGPAHIASLANNNMIWLLNDNNVSKANISNNKTNHKILSTSVKNISSEEVIECIEKNKLLKNIN
jgi:ADP-heptose:LPS heptosyltransferase